MSGAGKGRGTPAKSARRRARDHLADTPGFEKADAGHFEALLHGAIRAADELDELIAPNLDRKVAELSPVEHGVLMLAAFELSRMPEIPYRVVINEAVELAKTYGGTDGYKYVNGVLDRVAARLRPHEAALRG
ncbi:transcription antitermination factor NusB [Betaproteobacteria bacterium PRO1]|nr:transcription antitermination factor NusB [Betaproteobacteria bacterium PRO1]